MADLTALESEREMLMASTKSLAEFNLSRQVAYENDRSNLLVLVSDCNKLRSDIQDKAMKLMELTKKTSLNSTKEILLGATEKAEKDSETIAQSFLTSTINHDTFINTFIKERKVAHLRRIKYDKLLRETNDTWIGGIQQQHRQIQLQQRQSLQSQQQQQDQQEQ